MKKMQFLNVLLMMFAVVFASCSGDDEDPGVTQHQPKTRLVKVTNSLNNFETRYTYDNAARLIRQTDILDAGVEKHYDFTYRPDGKLDKVIGQGVTRVMAYNAQGQMSEINFYYGTDETVTPYVKYELTYPEANTMVVRIFYGTDPDAMRNVYIYDAKGNLSQADFYQDSNDDNPDGNYISSANWLENDDKNNPFRDFDKGYFYSIAQPNNVLREQSSGNPSVNEFTYEYNADNYPTTRTSDGGSATYYEYKKI